MFAQESVVDIQKLRQEFEKLPDIKGILYGSEFGFNESLNEYYHPDHTNHRLNYAFIMGAWMAWKAQTVPEGFVLVPMVPSERMINAVRQCYEGEAYLPYSLYSEFVNQAIIERMEAQELTND